jgi:hypothetical protein
MLVRGLQERLVDTVPAAAGADVSWQEEMLDEAGRLLGDSIYPAYRRLAQAIEEMLAGAPEVLPAPV